MASEQKRLFLALSLSAIILFTWQAYFAPKPIIEEKSDVKTNGIITDGSEITRKTKVGSKADGSAIDSSVGSIGASKSKKSTEASRIVLKNNGHELQITSQLLLEGFESSLSQDQFKDVVGESGGIQTFLIKNGKSVVMNFSFEKVSDSQLFGLDEVNGVKFEGELKPEGLFEWKLSSDYPQRFFFSLSSEKKEGEARQIRQFLGFLKDVERFNIDDEERFEGSLKWFGVDFHYHLFATVFNEKNSVVMNSKSENLGVTLLSPVNSISGYQILTMKNYDKLSGLGSNLKLAVDFGVFGIIAVPILRGLQFFYKYVPNYGLAIILITLFIRTLLFPLQFKSFKSMKKMQKLQPELAKVKEKYGDDPQRMQKETMELFKKNGANPMGGCLPLILQMPVFFAFYQVLFNSVELLNAPFFLWIHDLSVKDPYYVLPVLMGIAMFFQTRLNPSTTADPTQKKMMMFMPLIFTFFMKDLPAGLNLYIFVSTLFGIIQQLVVYKTTD